MKWEWLGQDGAVLGGGVTRLPVIKPGDGKIEVKLAPLAANLAPGNLVVSLISPTGYVAHEQWQTPPAEPPAEPPVTATSPPVIYRAYPFDGGFMLGYSTQRDDKQFTVEYGTASGHYSEPLTVALPGALAVRGLKNGQTYFVRLKRGGQESASAWSEEMRVTPDGGLQPAAPKLFGVVRGQGLAALRFEPVEKAIGYRVRWGQNADAALYLNCAATGQAIIEGLNDARAYTFTVTAITANGESDASNRVTAPVR